MKKTLLSVVALFAAHQFTTAQVVKDTITTGAGYANNIWYSLKNDDQATSPSNTWDIALTSDMGQVGTLTTSMLFNYKMGTVYEVPGSDGTSFSAADSAGITTWTPLYNSQVTWAKGAFNNTVSKGTLDYGWGSYNTTSHGIDANRVFIIKYTGGEYRKLIISSNNVAGTYTVVSSKLDNTDSHTKVINALNYSTKNFVYYKVDTDALIDREPARTNWDFIFHQYVGTVSGTPYPVTGIYQNVGVEVAKIHPVNNPATYEDHSSASFSADINTIGYDWKAFTGSAYVVEDSTVYFVKDVKGQIWKVIMNGFSGSAGGGKFMIGKEQLTFAGLTENATVFASVYPNPASGTATIVLNNAPDATVVIYNLMGEQVAVQSVDAASLTAVQLNTAEFANGVYQVVCTSGTTVNTQKLIVQH